jgi:hypothetical protein
VAREKEARMSLQLQIEEMPDFLIARFTGPGAAEEVWQQYESIAERCKRANKNKLLLDFLEAHGEISLVDRYFLGGEAQIFKRYNLQVATANRPEHLDEKKFVEIVARNRGVNFRVFTNVEDALEWLLK